jgi:hypothetical protein
MKKKILIGIGCLVLAVSIFCGGFYLGITASSWMFGVSKITEAYVTAATRWHSVKQLDQQDYTALKTGLNIQMDGDIIRLHYLISDKKNDKDADKGKKLLKAIAEHRDKYPPVYSASSSAMEVKKGVADILINYR